MPDYMPKGKNKKLVKKAATKKAELKPNPRRFPSQGDVTKKLKGARG